MEFEKCTVSVLKAKCKASGVAATGEKADLVRRLKQVEVGERFSAQLDGVNPAALKAGALKKALATRGLPCSLDLETRDELVARLIDALKKESPASGGGAEGGSVASADGEDDTIALAVDMAKQVLLLGEGGDAAGIFSLLGSPITTESPFAQQRKAYLQLSRMIHPDKLSRHFDGATRAFQELVRAFDVLTAPPSASAAAASTGGKKAASLARSNEGCFRTRAFCPRCSAEWGTADSGLEGYDYSLFMQGLKLYCCAGCLCEFGCVSASHRCPKCTRPFAYHPRDYHRHISCGNAKCKSTFGFWLYTVPARVEAELRVAIKAEQERRLKAREASAARLARAQRKAPALSDGARAKQVEACFVRGLVDACPRCGYEPPPGVKREELEAHLATCHDVKAHEAHRRGLAAAHAAAQKKEATADAEAEMQNYAAWQYLGGASEQMWMLTDTQLSKQCEEKGLDGSSRVEMLAALARHEAATKAATSSTKRLKGSASAEPAPEDVGPEPASKRAKGGGAAARMTAASLPSNLHSLSLTQLQSVCASHGMIPKGTTASAVIAEIEHALFQGTEAAPLLLE